MDRSSLFLCTINKGYLDKIDGKGNLGQRDNCKFEFTCAHARGSNTPRSAVGGSGCSPEPQPQPPALTRTRAWTLPWADAINRMGTKRVVPLVTSAQYTDPREWHGPVGGFLVDQFWECYVDEKQLETAADNIAARVLLHRCEREVRPPSSPCLCLPDSLVCYRHRLTTCAPRPAPGPPQAAPRRALPRRRDRSCRKMLWVASNPASMSTSRRRSSRLRISGCSGGLSRPTRSEHYGVNARCPVPMSVYLSVCLSVSVCLSL